MEKVLQEIANWIRNSEQKVVIGISGHGAAGKTTFANSLVNLLNQTELNYINTDPYLISSAIRKNTMINYEYDHKSHHYKMTACHPAAHNQLALERDIRMLREGLDFYSLGTHYSRSSLISSQRRINIIEGMSVAFVDPALFDLKVYFYTDGDTEFMRRSIRDVSERGTEFNYLIKSHEERRIQYELFMHPYHQNFDLVIKSSNEDFLVEKMNISDK